MLVNVTPDEEGVNYFVTCMSLIAKQRDEEGGGGVDNCIKLRDVIDERP